MKILVINWQDIRNPQSGGAEVHLHEIFSRVVGAGHEVTLFCSSFPGAPAEEYVDGIRVIREGGRFFFNFRVPFTYLKRFRHEPFDVVIDDLNKIPFFTPLFVHHPLIGIAHHLFGKSIFLETNALLASYVYVMEQAALMVYRNKGVPFMVVSESTKAEFLGHGFSQDDLPLAHNCVDHQRYRTTGVPKSRTPLIGYFGRLKKYKSVDHFLEVLPEMMKDIPGLRAIIMGDGDDRPRLEAIARDLGIAGRVTFTGFVGEEEKVRILQEMWLKVTPSSKEGWGLTVIEANACGTPVVAANVPGLRDAVRDGTTGYLYSYGDRKELAARINEVITNTPLREQLSFNAVKWAGQFDWNIVASTVVEILSQTIRRKKELHK